MNIIRVSLDNCRRFEVEAIPEIVTALEKLNSHGQEDVIPLFYRESTLSEPQVPLDDEEDQGLSLTPTFSKTQLLTIFLILVVWF